MSLHREVRWLELPPDPPEGEAVTIAFAIACSLGLLLWVIAWSGGG